MDLQNLTAQFIKEALPLADRLDTNRGELLNISRAPTQLKHELYLHASIIKEHCLDVTHILFIINLLNHTKS